MRTGRERRLHLFKEGDHFFYHCGFIDVFGFEALMERKRRTVWTSLIDFDTALFLSEYYTI